MSLRSMWQKIVELENSVSAERAKVAAQVEKREQLMENQRNVLKNHTCPTCGGTEFLSLQDERTRYVKKEKELETFYVPVRCYICKHCGLMQSYCDFQRVLTNDDIDMF